MEQMMIPLGLSVLLSLTALGMLAASAAMRQRLPADGVQPGDAYLYAVAGGIAALVAWLMVLVGALSAVAR